jgi:hypothetical protein
VNPNLRSNLEFKPFVHFWPVALTVESRICFNRQSVYDHCRIDISKEKGYTHFKVTLQSVMTFFVKRSINTYAWLPLVLSLRVRPCQEDDKPIIDGRQNLLKLRLLSS